MHYIASWDFTNASWDINLSFLPMSAKQSPFFIYVAFNSYTQ